MIIIYLIEAVKECSTKIHSEVTIEIVSKTWTDTSVTWGVEIIHVKSVSDLVYITWNEFLEFTQIVYNM